MLVKHHRFLEPFTHTQTYVYTHNEEESQWIGDTTVHEFQLRWIARLSAYLSARGSTILVIPLAHPLSR